MSEPTSKREQFLADCARIHHDWDRFAKTVDTEGLISLYAPDGIMETPLLQSIDPDAKTGVLRGHAELCAFFSEGARRRPNELVRWHRTDKWLTDGERLLMWEYPRETPDGDQVDLLEVMEIADGLIQHHRVYWGWFGGGMLINSAVNKAIGG